MRGARWLAGALPLLLAASCGGGNGVGGTTPNVVVPPPAPPPAAVTEGSPCSGVVLGWSPPGETPGGIFATTLALSLTPTAAETVVFDWEAPYIPIDAGGGWTGAAPWLDAIADAWDIEVLPDETRHTIVVEWWRERIVRLRFRSVDGTCDPDRNRLECRTDGCTLAGSS